MLRKCLFFSSFRHITSIHEKKKPYKCPRCEKHFAQQSHISGHIKAVHEKIKDKQCPLCDYKCTTNQQINAHIMAIHEGIKQYKCSWCEACFSAKHCLEGHIASVHEGNIQFFFLLIPFDLCSIFCNCLKKLSPYICYRIDFY